MLTFDRQFFLAYRSLCPSGWVERWNDQRGTPPCSHQLLYATNTKSFTRERHFPSKTGPVDCSEQNLMHSDEDRTFLGLLLIASRYPAPSDIFLSFQFFLYACASHGLVKPPHLATAFLSWKPSGNHGLQNCSRKL